MDKLIWRVQRVGHLESTFKILGSGAPIVPQSQIVCSHLKYQTVNSRDFFFGSTIIILLLPFNYLCRKKMENSHLFSLTYGVPLDPTLLKLALF